MDAQPTADEDKLLDYVEAQSAENFKFHVESASILSREAVTTFSWLIPIIGASVAFCISAVIDGHPVYVIAAVGAMAVYLTLAGSQLVRDALMAESIPAPGNEPKNLLQDDYGVNKIRRSNLDSVQTQIDRIRKRNAAKGAAINKCRKAILKAPVYCVAAGLVTAFVLRVYPA